MDDEDIRMGPRLGLFRDSDSREDAEKNSH